MDNPFDTLNDKLDIIIQHMDRLFKPTPQSSPEHKEWMNLDELIQYLPHKPAKPTIYGYVSAKTIPSYKQGKSLMFRTSEIDVWLMAGKQKTLADIERDTDAFLAKHRRKRK